jgi:hypothetical protein
VAFTGSGATKEDFLNGSFHFVGLLKLQNAGEEISSYRCKCQDLL